ERPHSARRAIDQDLLTRLDVSLVAKGLQRRDARNVNRSRLLKRQVGRFQSDCSIRTRAHILSKGAAPSAEYLITWFELRDILADSFNGPRKVNTEPCVLWFAQADPHRTHDVRSAFDEMPVVWI